MRRRPIAPRGDYGIDAPYVSVSFAGAAIFCAGVAVLCFELSLPLLAGVALLIAIIFALSTLSYLWTRKRGKGRNPKFRLRQFLVWAELLDALPLRGDESLLDVGCGRGAVLMLSAKRIPRGRVVGLDLWSTTDQSGNCAEATLRNAEREGVRDRIELCTGDMRKLPFPDQSFDVVTSSLAIHNIRDQAGREQALAEIIRVLKPGGSALVADFRHTADYQQYLAAQPDVVAERRRLDWRFWYGGPQASTSLVTVRRLP